MGEERDERLVPGKPFGGVLGRGSENVGALGKLGADTGYLMVRNLRLAGRRDIARLGQQLAGTEDKLESVLQEVERLQDDLRTERERSARTNGARRSRTEST